MGKKNVCSNIGGKNNLKSVKLTISYLFQPSSGITEPYVRLPTIPHVATIAATAFDRNNNYWQQFQLGYACSNHRGLNHRREGDEENDEEKDEEGDEENQDEEDEEGDEEKDEEGTCCGHLS